MQLFPFAKSYGQKSATDEEIIEIWKKTQLAPTIDSVFRWDVQLQTRMVLDDLLNNGIDTLIVFSVRYPGYASTEMDTCISKYMINSYFLWQHHGKHHLKIVNGQCKLKESPVDGEVLRFAIENFAKIKDEHFIQSIHSVDKDGDRLRAKSNLVNHEPKYSILIVLREKYKYLGFTENDLIDKEGIFTDYNRKLTSFKLFELINSSIEKVE